MEYFHEISKKIFYHRLDLIQICQTDDLRRYPGATNYFILRDVQQGVP